MIQANRRRAQGIECPKCGHQTLVVKTTNLVSWILRIRLCQNSRCRHSFETEERAVRAEDNRPSLFN